MKTKCKPKRKDIYDREIDRLVKLEFDRVTPIWCQSSTARKHRNAGAVRLFSVCGDADDVLCGCPSQIVGGQFEHVKAQTAELTKAIMQIDGIPASFHDLRKQWERGTEAQRRKLFLPFKKAQVMTDKVLKKLAKEKSNA